MHLKNFIICFVAIFLSLFTSEMIMRVFSPPVKNPLIQYTYKDAQKDILLMRSEAPGHDRYGFRNIRVPDTCNILILGDSQTYGNGVLREETYPSLLGEDVYSMALGGYGPVEYDYFWHKYGSRMKPKTVVIGFYSGNDLCDVLQLKDKLDLFGLKDLFDAPTTYITLDEYNEYVKVLNASKPMNTVIKANSWMRIHSRLYDWTVQALGLTCARNLGIHRKLSKNMRNMRPNDFWYEDAIIPYEDENIRTIFTPTRRGLLSNINNEDVKKSLKFTLKLFQKMSEETNLYLLYIPTKEEVYYPYLKERINIPRNYEFFIANTRKIRKELKTLPLIDALPALQRAANEGNQLYPNTLDGHPNKLGHKIISKVLKKGLRNE